MGPHEPTQVAGHDLNILGEVVAPSQELSYTIANNARTSILHMPYKDQVATTGNSSSINMEKCMGKLQFSTHTIKLSEGDHGTVLVKGNSTFKNRVGVLARCPGFELTLSRLREDLLETVPAFMLPTALRVLRTGEEIERVHSEKVARIPTVEKFFSGNSGAELWDLRF
ncbi:hypothetical protein N8T08_009479 [Aspergillus melleus]|uniref:Uncharacterized protein n=1 Tax=Aspergillus melleus TaxID=138277 RepID=A0ACC3BCJ8_9EURO|nr:hypothetical protein N8T08_009479 [Aspergillus melleus]